MSGSIGAFARPVATPANSAMKRKAVDTPWREPGEKRQKLCNLENGEAIVPFDMQWRMQWGNLPGKSRRKFYRSVLGRRTYSPTYSRWLTNRKTRSNYQEVSRSASSSRKKRCRPQTTCGICPSQHSLAQTHDALATKEGFRSAAALASEASPSTDSPLIGGLTNKSSGDRLDTGNAKVLGASNVTHDESGTSIDHASGEEPMQSDPNLATGDEVNGPVASQPLSNVPSHDSGSHAASHIGNENIITTYAPQQAYQKLTPEIAHVNPFGINGLITTAPVDDKLIPDDGPSIAAAPEDGSTGLMTPPETSSSRSSITPDQKLNDQFHDAIEQEKSHQKKKADMLLKKAADVHNNRRKLVDSLPPAQVLGPDLASSYPLNLHNPHQWCYRRACQQALLNLPIFARFLQDHKRRLPCVHLPIPKDCAACAWHAIHVGLEKRDRLAVRVATTRLDRIMASVCEGQHDWARNEEQADSHEFLTEMINVLHKQQAGDPELLHSIFSIQDAWSYDCVGCKAPSSPILTNEDGLHLPVSDSKNQTADIQKLFSETFRFEAEVESECDHCRKKFRQKREKTITAAPEVLFVQLLRFKGHFDKVKEVYGFVKNNRMVAIPERLDLEGYVSEQMQTSLGAPHYKLHSIVCHKGDSTIEGHYRTIVDKSTSSKKSVWIFDDLKGFRGSPAGDARVAAVQGDFTPYIVTYVRCAE